MPTEPDWNTTPTAEDMRVPLSKFSKFTAVLVSAAVIEAVYTKLRLRKLSRQHFNKIVR